MLLDAFSLATLSPYLLLLAGYILLACSLSLVAVSLAALLLADWRLPPCCLLHYRFLACLLTACHINLLLAASRLAHCHLLPCRLLFIALLFVTLSFAICSMPQYRLLLDAWSLAALPPCTLLLPLASLLIVACRLAALLVIACHLLSCYFFALPLAACRLAAYRLLPVLQFIVFPIGGCRWQPYYIFVV